MNPYYAGLIRGAIGGFFQAGALFFGTWAASDAQTAALVGGGAFFSYMALRFAEGSVDANTKGKS